VAKIKITKEIYLQWYESMLLQRRFEERAGMLYGQQKIRGFCHLYIGQEAISAGIVSATRLEDPIITAYRDHGLGLARGMTPNECMAELFGKATGSSKGKGGSMHFFSKPHYFFGGHVCVTLFGDGAARQGALHETFNMAMTWKLPVIFIVENNGYAMGTSVERTTNVEDIWKLGLGYEMPSEPVDGMHPLAVHKAIEKAAEHARKGKGPTFLEVRTYRYKGHSMSDPQKYRTKEEVESYKKLDPIEQVLSDIKKKKYATATLIKEINTRVKQQVDECVEFAENSPFPDDSELYKDVYYQQNYPYLA